MLTAIFIVLILIFIAVVGIPNFLMGLVAIILYPYMWFSDRLYSRKLSKNYNPYAPLITLYKCYDCGGFQSIHYEGCKHFKG